MKHLYLFTLEIAPLEVGKTYDELPSHLTLMSRFLSDMSAEEVADKVRPLFMRTAPIHLAFGETIQLGPKKVAAHMVNSPDEGRLHGNLRKLLDRVEVEYQYPEFIGSGHKPHVTERGGVQFVPSSTLTASVVYLIEVVDKKRVVRARLELMDEVNIDASAQTIWHYTKMSDVLEPADAIIAMGSMDLRVAERAAELWHAKLAPVVVVTGGLGRLTGDDKATSEAAKFAEVLRVQGVPEDAILIEDKASNGAENFTFSIELLHSKGNAANSVIAVTQPYMERRAYATAKKLFPGLHVHMASPEVAYEDYPTAEVPKNLMIDIIVGEPYRIKTYPDKGFTIPQDIPLEVEKAMETLIQRGFTAQLPK